MARRPTILLVEENANAQASMAQVLRSAGYRVVVAADADEGWKKAVYEQPECLIIDAILPGKSGFDLCRQIRAWDPTHRVAVLLLGPRENPIDRTWGLRQGADLYLPKPFTEDVLIQMVSSVVPAYAPGQAFQQSTGREEVTPVPQEPVFAWWLLIPQRREDPNLMASVNPFSGAQVIADKEARRLYAAIDGRKTLEDLAQALNLKQKGLVKALRLLFTEKRIHLVSADGQVDDGAWLFDQRLG
jgi:twitching motility two-component system response regulator PilH